MSRLRDNQALRGEVRVRLDSYLDNPGEHGAECVIEGLCDLFETHITQAGPGSGLPMGTLPPAGVLHLRTSSPRDGVKFSEIHFDISHGLDVKVLIVQMPNGDTEGRTNCDYAAPLQAGHRGTPGEADDTTFCIYHGTSHCPHHASAPPGSAVAGAALDAAKRLLAENRTVEHVRAGEDETGERWGDWDMCAHCGVEVEDCDEAGTCWGARVRAFLGPVAAPAAPPDSAATRGKAGASLYADDEVSDE